MPVRPSVRTSRSPWRYGLILVVVCLAVVVAAAAGWRFARTSASPSNGPVVLVSIDGLRADRLPIYGYRQGRTPAIDALARDSVVFERAYSHSPLGRSSHVSILSGQLPFESGVRDAGDVVRADAVLLPHLLHARGYKTGAAVSSISLGPAAGLARAFDFYDADRGEPPAASAGSRPGDKTTEVARKWADSVGSPRFLLFLQFGDIADGDVQDAVAGWPQGAYDEQVTKADGLVAQVVKWLKGRGLYDRATIVVLAAHGLGLGSHGEQGHGLLLYDETIHVPMIIKLPRDVGRGKRVAVPVQHVDLLPTILDLLDAPKPPISRGRSLRPLAIGNGAAVVDEGVYAETSLGRQLFGWSALQSWTDARYRYVRAPRDELYDLREDPGERRNIAADQPAVVQQMRAALAQLDGGSQSANGAEAGVDPKDRVEAYEKYVRAASLMEAGRLFEAAAAWRDFLAMEPASVGGWRQLATVLERAGRFSDAAEAYGRLLTFDARSADAWLGSAYALLRAGKMPQARAAAERAVDLAPARAHEMLARIAVERKDWTEAARQADFAQQSDVSTTAAPFVKGMQFYKAGQYEQALPLLEAAARPAQAGVQPVPDVGPCLADALGRLERYAEAEVAWKEEILRSPYTVQARVSLAMLYHAQRRDAEAEEKIRDMVRAVPTPDAYNAAARLWTILGEKDRADEVRADARLRFGDDATKPRAR
ncbi:MAG: sulfatase-like hydrolase/transferase [Bacteroidales bacterium]